jgi:hypothetical protein
MNPREISLAWIWYRSILGGEQFAGTPKMENIETAVKRIRRSQCDIKGQVNYSRKLEAIENFSHRNVGNQ